MVVTLEESIDELEGKTLNALEFFTHLLVLDEVHGAKLRNKESSASLDQIFTEIGFA